MCGRPLLGREIERRQTVRKRNDDAASRKHVGRVAVVARRGVQTEGVLEAHVGPAELGEITEDAVTFGHVCIFKIFARDRPRGSFTNAGPGQPTLRRPLISCGAPSTDNAPTPSSDASASRAGSPYRVVGCTERPARTRFAFRSAAGDGLRTPNETRTIRACCLTMTQRRARERRDTALGPTPSKPPKSDRRITMGRGVRDQTFPLARVRGGG
jgi:hypothetical protein